MYVELFRKSFLNLTVKQVWKTVQVVAEIKVAYFFSETRCRVLLRYWQ